MRSPDLDVAPIAELEAAAAAVMDDDAWGYFATGVRDERTLHENEAAWDAWWLRPRRLTGSWEASIATTLLGREVAHPIIVGPSAVTRLAHPDGELGVARAVASLGGTMVLSTSSMTPIEEVAGVTGLDLWFQLYPFEDVGFTDALVARAVAAGVRAIVLTIDVTSEADASARPTGGFDSTGVTFALHSGHEPVMRHLDWAWAERLSSTCGVPVVLKGVLHPADAAEAVLRGFAGIVVSNHGGRKLEASMPSAMALPACVEAADGRIEVYVDGGIRRGGHALIALGLGAHAVMIARPTLWGLALGGSDGARRVLARFVRELAEDAALADIADIRDIPRDTVVPATWLPRAANRRDW